jgi:hypothetical protein
MAQRAVRWCRDNGHVVVTSVGVPTRNLVTALCAIEQVSCELVFPSAAQMDAEMVMADYGLSQNTTQISVCETSVVALTKENRLHQIDDQILQHSDIVLPLSMHKRGYMQSCLDMADREGKEIVYDFEVAHERSSTKAGYSIESKSFSDDIRSFNEPFLIHWTRTSIGPWPGERAIDYYRHVIESSTYPRSGFDSLLRILSTSQILASSRHIATFEPVVALSSLSPCEVLPLIRWRPRYRQMSFEPYGIGIRYSAGLSMGIRPVVYLPSSATKTVQDSERWLTQSVGKKTDWRRECEYRYRGNFDLRNASSADICIFARTKLESKEISERFGLTSYWFEK